MNRDNATANFDMKQLLKDILTILLAYVTANLFTSLFMNRAVNFDTMWIYLIFSIIFIMNMMVVKMYNITTFYYMNRIVQRVIISVGIAGLCIIVMIFFSKMQTVSRLFFLLFCILSCGFIIVERCIVRWMRKVKIGNGYTHVISIGDDETINKYQGFIEKTAMKIKVDKHLHPNNPALASKSAFENMLKSVPVDEVLFIYSSFERNTNLREMMDICNEMGLTVRVILDITDLPNSKRFVSSIGTYPVITFHSISFNKVSLFVKSMIDLFGALCGLVVLSPIFALTAMAIKLESPGPAIYTSTRIGLNGKPFKMYKFRSMFQDAEARKKELMEHNQIEGGFMFKMDNDPRITKVGKFIRKTSIDELPQLINVLMHHMSLVGTRPPTPDEVEKYNRSHWRRISIKPGITGMWQSSGRSEILDFDQVVALDKQYIDEWSLALDIKIIFKTVAAVVMRRGAK